MSNGKGDDPRPLSVSREEFERNWERAFPKEESCPTESSENSGPTGTAPRSKVRRRGKPSSTESG